MESFPLSGVVCGFLWNSWFSDFTSRLSHHVTRRLPKSNSITNCDELFPFLPVARRRFQVQRGLSLLHIGISIASCAWMTSQNPSRIAWFTVECFVMSFQFCLLTRDRSTIKMHFLLIRDKEVGNQEKPAPQDNRCGFMRETTTTMSHANAPWKCIDLLNCILKWFFASSCWHRKEKDWCGFYEKESERRRRSYKDWNLRKFRVSVATWKEERLKSIIFYFLKFHRRKTLVDYYFRHRKKDTKKCPEKCLWNYLSGKLNFVWFRGGESEWEAWINGYKFVTQCY